MKPWKVVILCSLSMFTGSLYQGCVVDNANAEDDEEDDAQPYTSTGSSVARTVIGPIHIQHFEAVDGDGDFFYWCNPDAIYKTADGSGQTRVLLTAQPTRYDYTTYCCPEGFSYKGYGGGIYCLEDL